MRLPHAPSVPVVAVIAMCAIGVIGAGLGFEIGRRWPIEPLEKLVRRYRPSEPPRGWRELARTDLPRYEHARAMFGDTLYLFGGFWTAHPKATPRVEALNLGTGSWRRLQNMPVALTHANAAVIGDTVWLVGGFEGDHPGSTTARVWRWNSRGDVWSEGPPLPEPRGSGALVALGDTLHYFGGFLPDRNTDSPDHWQLRSTDAHWQRRAPLPHPRGHLSGAVLDGLIYAIGGNIGHDPVPIDVTFAERYRPDADAWEPITLPPFPISHAENATFAYDGRIITVGGRAKTEGRENLDDILAFNPATQRWVHLGRLPVPLLGAVAVAVGDTLTAGMGAVNGNEPTNPSLWQTQLRNVWRTADSLPTPIGETAGGVIDGSLYLVGEGTRETLRYDLAAGQWTRRHATTRPAPGHHHAAEVLGGQLWLFGGLSLASEGLVQIFDPASRSWRFGPSMPFPAGSSASTVIGGRFFLAGGIVGDSTTDAAAMLDPATMNWSPIAPMPRPRNHAASATDGERFYIFGGRGPGSGAANVVADGFDDVQIYDPRTDTWRVSDGSPGAPLPLPQARGGMGKALWLNGEFWVLGGETERGAGATPKGTYDRVDVYNPKTNRWRAGAPLPTARHGIFPVLYEGEIVVAGGGAVSGNSQSQVMEVLWPR